MKFAFSTVACPAWDFSTIASRAKEYGYDGVEIRGFLNESILTAANIFLTDPAKVKFVFADAGLSIACLASSIKMTNDRKLDAKAADDLRQFIDTAVEIGCPLVKIFDTMVRPGSLVDPRAMGNRSRASAILSFGDWLAPLGDYAGAAGVTIVVENALSFRSAKEMWLILDRMNHPCIAAALDVFNSTLLGESPGQAVSFLNSRVQYTQVKDAKLGTLGASYTQLGDGDVPVKQFLMRLLGIGYDGWVTFEWEKAWLPNLAEPQDILPGAIKILREWTKPAGEEAEASSDAAAASK